MYDQPGDIFLPEAPADAPLVTVVIPTYNRLPFITEAVRSVIAQTFTNWELIIADDGSTDGTAQVQMELHDARVKVMSLPHTGNIAWMRNVAAEAGKGKWIAFLDSDDIWVPEKLDIQLNSLQQSARRWGYGGFTLIDEEGMEFTNDSAYTPFSGWIADRVIAAEAAVSIGSLVVERSLFNEAGCFNTALSLLYREDYDLALRLSLLAAADASPVTLVKIREHRGRSTNTVADSHERTAATYAHFLSLRPAATLKKIAHRRRGYHLAEAARINFLKKRYALAGRQFGKAITEGDRLRHLLAVVKRTLSVNTHQQ